MQPQLSGNIGYLSLHRLVVSPYHLCRWGTSITTMIVKFRLQEYTAGANGMMFPFGSFTDISTNTFLSSYLASVDTNQYANKSAIRAAIYATIVTQAVSVLGYSTFTAADIDDLDVTDIATPVESALSLSVQTSTGAVGTQVSVSQNAWVLVSGVPVTTASIAGNAAADIIIEVAPTNSATAGDWVEKGRLGNAQALSLAITLQSVQTTKSQIVAFVPAGYYVKARSSGSGTVSYTLGAIRQVLL